MKSMGKQLLVIVPILAVTAFLLVKHQLGGIAPATPKDNTEVETLVPTVPREPLATVLEPEPITEEVVLPPGAPTGSLSPSPSDEVDEEAIIPIADLQSPPAEPPSLN